MATTRAPFSAGALALVLLLCSVSLSAADVRLTQGKGSAGYTDDAPTLTGTEMADYASALASMRRLFAQLEPSLSQTEGAQGLERAEGTQGAGGVEKGKGRSLAATPPLQLPKTCPRAGCNCLTVSPNSPCPRWVCCSKTSAFQACGFDHAIMKKCKGPKSIIKEQCVLVKKAIVDFGTFLGGIAKRAAKRCKGVAAYNDVLGLVRRDLAVMYKRCC